MEHGSAKIKELVCGLTSNRWRSQNPCPMRLTPSLRPGPWALRQPLSHRLSLPKSSLVPPCVKARQGAPEAAGSGPSLAPSIRRSSTPQMLPTAAGQVLCRRKQHRALALSMRTSEDKRGRLLGAARSVTRVCSLLPPGISFTRSSRVGPSRFLRPG